MTAQPHELRVKKKPILFGHILRSDSTLGQLTIDIILLGAYECSNDDIKEHQCKQRCAKNAIYYYGFKMLIQLA